VVAGLPSGNNVSHRYLSPLRYPGGKASLSSFIKLLVTRNSLEGGEYVEVYAGGASVGLALLLEGYSSRVHINDIDAGVHAFWHSVLYEPDELCRLVRNRRVSAREWERQRQTYCAPSEHSQLELGFATFFLNRTNRSGIICSGGMIGGRKQDGDYRLDARYNKKDLISRIEQIAEHASQIKLYRMDGAKLISELLPKLPANSFAYLDPPYYIKGGRRLYKNSYSHDDHRGIAKLLRASNTPWVLTYDNVPEIRSMYSGHRAKRFSLRYTARRSYQGEEVIFFSSSLKIPKIRDLTGVEVRDRAQRERMAADRIRA
jgi:DNA adenine methylase